MRQEYNRDYRGNLTLCCKLSAYAGGTSEMDWIGNCHAMSLAEAVARFRQRVASYQAKVSRGEFGALDHFPCWYRVQYLDKAPGLTRFPTTRGLTGLPPRWRRRAMVTLDHQVRSHAEVVDTELETGETVLLQLESKTYYSLNVTGTQIWQGLKQRLPLQEVSRRLQARFKVEPERADRSVLTLVDELLQHQLVQRLEA